MYVRRTSYGRPCRTSLVPCTAGQKSTGPYRYNNSSTTTVLLRRVLRRTRRTVYTGSVQIALHTAVRYVRGTGTAAGIL